MIAVLEEIKHLLAPALPDFPQSFNPPAGDESIMEAEAAMGCQFPEPLRALYRIHNGEGAGYGLFFGMPLLSLSDVVEHWRRCADAAAEAGGGDDVSIHSIPFGWTRERYADARWIPISYDFAGNYLGVDMAPGPNGVPGQVISFGRDEVEHQVIATSVYGLLCFVRGQISAGNYRILTEDGDRVLLLKEPANFHFLDALRSLDLPYDPAGRGRVSGEHEEPDFDQWYDGLSEAWKEIVDKASRRGAGFKGIRKETRILAPFDASGLNDLAPVAFFTDVRELFLGKSEISDLSPLRELPHLKRLSIATTPVIDLAPLSDVHSLVELDVSSTRVADLRPLASLPNLRHLDVSNTNVDDLGFLRNLSCLKWLNISNTRVSDLSPLAGLKALSEVVCSAADAPAIGEAVGDGVELTVVDIPTDVHGGDPGS